MKWLFKWVFRLLLLAAVLLVALLLGKDPLGKEIIRYQLRARTGLEAAVGRVSVGIFSPVVDVERLRIYNSAEFGGALLLDAPEVHVEYDRPSLLNNRLRLKLVRLRIAELNVVRSGAGRTNLLHLDWKNPIRAFKSARQMSFPEIEVLNLSLDRVRFLDLDHPRRNREFRANLDNQIFRNIRSMDDLRGLLFLLWLRSGQTGPVESSFKSGP